MVVERALICALAAVRATVAGRHNFVNPPRSKNRSINKKIGYVDDPAGRTFTKKSYRQPVGARINVTLNLIFHSTTRLKKVVLLLFK